MYNILGLIYKDKIIETRSPSTSVHLAPVRVCISHQHWCASHTNIGVPLTLMGCEYHIASWALNILFLSNPSALETVSATVESMPNVLGTLSQPCESMSDALETLSQPCESMSDVPEKVSQPCESMPDVPEKVSQPCESMPDASEKVSQPCESMPDVLEMVSATWESIPFAIEMQFSYDSWGRIDTLIYPDGEIVKYRYDRGGMLKSFSGIKGAVPYDYVKEIGYDKFGAKTIIKYGNDLVTVHTYYPHNLRLTSSNTFLQSGSTYQNATYRYDKKGNITFMRVLNNWPNNNHFVDQHFEYDSADQLVGATGREMNAADHIYNLNVSYDAYGKINTYRTDLRDRNLNIVQQQNSRFTYQNTHSTAFAPVSSYDSVSNAQTSYTFGINGSLRTKATPEKTEYYLFNALNNLKVYSDNGESYGYYGYDANGERTYKIKYNTVSSRVNRYGEVTKTLETEKITYYPNGYINIITVR